MMKKVLLLVVLIGISLNYYASAGLTVQTKDGRYRGYNFPNGARAFLGIPFAQPPVGDLRWRRAVAAKSFKGIRDAIVSGPCCPQSGLFKNLTVAESEDCLTLDIYTPKNSKPGKKLPVKVYIHGGGFAANSAALYPGDQLAVNGSSVVVIINYRLSYQGFVVFTPLLKEDGGVVNYGLTDQQLALKWIQNNINAFGGDKDNVLIFGNSAGGMSVLMHYTFPSSKGLFKVGVAESAGPWNYITAQNAAANNDPGAARFGCLKANGKVNITCLRAVPITSFYNYTWSGSQPTIDNLFTGPIAPTFANAKAMKKSSRANNPIIIGHSAYEGNQFAWLGLRSITKLPNPPLVASFPVYFGILNVTLPFTQAVTQEIATYYSSFAVNGTNGTVNYYNALREALGDFGIKCGNTRAALKAVSGIGKGSVYNYYFSHNTENWRYTFLNATHTVEIPYLFLTNGTIFETKFTTAESALANRLVDFTTKLQTSGQPTNNNKWRPLRKSGTASTYTWDLEHQLIDIVIPPACTKYWNSMVVDQAVTRDSRPIFNYDKFLNPQDDTARELSSMFY